MPTAKVRSPMDYPEYQQIRDKLLVEWQAKKTALDTLKAEELEARKRIVELMYDKSKIGSQCTYKLGNGYKVTVKIPVHFSFIKDHDNRVDVAKLKETIYDIAIGAGGGTELTDSLVRWKPELSVSTYRELEPKYRQLIDEVVVTTVGTPQVEILTPPSTYVPGSDD